MCVPLGQFLSTELCLPAGGWKAHFHPRVAGRGLCSGLRSSDLQFVFLLFTLFSLFPTPTSCFL